MTSTADVDPSTRHLQHLSDLERKRLLIEKEKEKGIHGVNRNRGPNSNVRNNNGRFGGGAGANGGGANGSDNSTNPTGDWSQDDRPDNGTIKALDLAERRGIIASPKDGDILFYLEQCKYGMRMMKINDLVTFRRDTFKPRPVAIDVTPATPLVGGMLTQDDINFYINEANVTKNAPIYRMRTILLSREEWPVFLASIPPQRIMEVVIATIRMCTCHDQLNSPIHVGVIRRFLQLLAWAGDSGQYGNAANATAGSSTPAAGDSASASPSSAPGGSQGPSPAVNPSAVPAGRRQPQPLFPNHMIGLTATPPDTITAEDLTRRINIWIDVAELILLFRRLTEVEVDAVATPLIAAAQHVLDTMSVRMGLAPTLVRALRQIIRRASPSESAFVRSAIIPTVSEMSVPTWDPTSAFNAKNLPIVTAETFPNSDDYVVAHCRLLRADNFCKTINVIGHLCYDIRGFKDLPALETVTNEEDGTTSTVEKPLSSHVKARLKETMEDSNYHSLFDRITFMGRVLSRANDFKTSKSYIFGLEEAPKTNEKARPVRWLAALKEGSLVCITTGQDRSVIDANEIFWGVISASDEGFRAHHMVAVHPVQGDFERLLANLERNKAAGAEAKSMLLETNVFFTGYKSVMEGLLTYIGPHSAKVPFKEILLAASRNDITEGGPENDEVEELLPGELPRGLARVIKNPNRVKDSNTWHIPKFGIPAFRQLVHNSRATYTFDIGQDQSMRKLDRRPIMLVQGPPGTGKSFMGCRIVETYVRYKQMIASGELLNVVDIDALPDPQLATIAPTLEADKPNYLGPIVVITYKNHALDEFLLDMRRSKLWDHERSRGSASGAGSGGISYPRGCRIVRVGTRSAEAELDDFNLNSLMGTSSVLRQGVAPYRERIGILAGRMERIAKEIAFLEKGNVPTEYFRSWLTEEQRKTIAPHQRESWLKGDNYSAASHGQLSGGLVPPTHFISYLRSDLRERIERSVVVPPETLAAAGAAGAPEENTRTTNSVFGNMEKEIREAESATKEEVNTSGEFFVSERFAASCISAESIRHAFSPPQCPSSVPNPSQLMSLWSLAPIARHQYYAYLIQRCIGEKVKQYLSAQEQIETTVILRQHAQDEARLQLLQQADVIGLTTTGCAMNQALLRALKPRLLVVEEAAEVLESQLIACMSESLSQLVLIGDHYQLKPSIQNYELEIHNKFNTSLFERLTNLIDPILLVEQRRMRPGISCLIRQFYDRQGLQDHTSVLSRPFIDVHGHKHFQGALGLQNDAFLWSHTHPEESATSGLSKINILEIRLCHILVAHLTSQGVSPSSITVITPYLGQRKALSATFANSDHSAVRRIHVSTVDLFQGDENDIVIVSLVRTAKLTEFMKMRNRMIVACSRARHAMVLIGSEELLSQSEHWNEVLMNLRNQNCVGEALPITHDGKKRLLFQDGTTIDV